MQATGWKVQKANLVLCAAAGHEGTNAFQDESHVVVNVLTKLGFFQPLLLIVIHQLTAHSQTHHAWTSIDIHNIDINTTERHRALQNEKMKNDVDSTLCVAPVSFRVHHSIENDVYRKKEQRGYGGSSNK